MISVPIPSLLQLFLLSVAVYGFYRIHWELTIGATRRRISKEKGCLPAKRSRAKLPLGLDKFYEGIMALKAHKLLELLSQRFVTVERNTYVTVALGKPTITTMESENVKAVLATDFKSWGLGDHRIKAIESVIGKGILTSEGAAWQHSRELLRPSFVRSQVGDLASFERHVDHLIQAIPRDGSTVDLQELFPRLTLDVATDFLFGESVESLKPGLDTTSSSEFARSIAYCASCLEAQGRFGILGAFLPTWVDSKLVKSIEAVQDYVDALISKCLAHHDSTAPKADSSPSRYVLLHELAAQTSDKRWIRSELLHVLMASRDTTAALLANVMFQLARRPDIWARLQAEVAALGDDPLSFESLKNMKYLRALINECLRLYPIVPANNRTALVDTVLPRGGGDDETAPIFVPKGTMVFWVLWAMHRRADYYGDDAAAFRPERWLDDGSTKGLRLSWEYLPFHGGPRICIGQQFALTETAYVLVRLAREFVSVESRDPEPWREKLALVCTSLGGCLVGLTPRS